MVVIRSVYDVDKAVEGQKREARNERRRQRYWEKMRPQRLAQEAAQVLRVVVETGFTPTLLREMAALIETPDAVDIGQFDEPRYVGPGEPVETPFQGIRWISGAATALGWE